MSGNETLKTLDRAIRVLKLFSPTESEFTLTEFHTRLGISISSLQRILQTLTKEGFLEKDEETEVYRLGMELYFLGNLVEEHSQLISIAKEEMELLNSKTGETITLNIINQNKRKCIGYIQAKHELTTLSFLSNESPLYAGASAKVLLAFLETEEQAKIIEQMDIKKITDYTVGDINSLVKQLEDIRNQGYAISESERILGVYTISAPIKNRLGHILASITITIPSVRVNKNKINEYIQLVKECSYSISQKMGSVAY